MPWEKLGLLWAPADEAPWARSHATLPVVHAPSPGTWNVLLSCRDAAGKPRIGRLAATVDDRPRAGLFDP
ncbi:MAG TPA: hypothetical protein PKC18_15915, partial [Lacipirellulaceae bacterium]|nr:hypothetical protein [Lacipirellulaceae bacterium]